MDNINFLFFDDIDLKALMNTDQLRVLRQNDDGTFRLANLPYNINVTFQEFQRQMGPLVYVIDENKDAKLIEKYGSTKMNHLERVSEIDFLFFDDIDLKALMNTDQLRVLKKNENGTFRADKLIDITEEIKPLIYLVDGKLEKFRPLIYIVDENKDSELIEKCGKDKIKRVKICSDSYHVVAGYDKNSICVKDTDIAKPTNEPSLRFVRVDRMGKKNNSKKIIMLRKNDDDTVSIIDAPMLIKKSLSQYEDTNNCLLVAAIGEKDLYDDDDIIQLEETGVEGRYKFSKPKVKKINNI